MCSWIQPNDVIYQVSLQGQNGGNNKAAGSMLAGSVLFPFFHDPVSQFEKYLRCILLEFEHTSDGTRELIESRHFTLTRLKISIYTSGVKLITKSFRGAIFKVSRVDVSA